MISTRPSPLNDASVDVACGTLEVQATPPTGAKSMFAEWMVLDVGKLTRAAIEAL